MLTYRRLPAPSLPYEDPAAPIRRDTWLLRISVPGGRCLAVVGAGRDDARQPYRCELSRRGFVLKVVAISVLKEPFTQLGIERLWNRHPRSLHRRSKYGHPAAQ